jgi:hypothetical protein
MAPQHDHFEVKYGESWEQGNGDMSASVSSDAASSPSALGSHVPTHDASKQLRERLVGSESRRVGFWKAVVLVFIIVTAAGVVTGTFLFLQSSEQAEFEDAVRIHAKLPCPSVLNPDCSPYHCWINHQYKQVTSTIRQATEAHLENLREALRTQSTEITGEARNSNSSFPFVVLPKFELTGQSVRARSSIEKSSFCPIVTRNHLAAWEEFTVQNQGWIAESRNVALLS